MCAHCKQSAEFLYIEVWLNMPLASGIGATARREAFSLETSRTREMDT